MNVKRFIKKFNWLFFLFIVPESQAQSKEGWLTWKSGDSLSVSYPKEWAVMKLNSGEVVALVAPKDNEQDHYSDMLVLRIFPDSGATNIEQVKNFAATTLSPQWNFKITSSQTLGEKGEKYIKSVAEDKGKKVILVMYTMLQNDLIYFLTLNIEKRNYERYKADADTAFKSLVVKRGWKSNPVH